MHKLSKRTAHFILLAVLIVSFGLNVYGNDFPLGYHSDELKKVDFILFGEQDFKHPILILQTVRVVNAFLGLHTRMPIVILSRFTTALYGTLIVLLAYKLARQRLGRGFALGVSALTAVSPSIVIHSHYLKEDIAFTFATLLTILGFFNLVQHLLKTESQKIPRAQTILLGIAIGFVVSAQYKSGIILLTFFLVPLYIPQLRNVAYIQTLIIAFIIGFIIFLGINFPIITEFDTFMDGFDSTLTHSLTGHNGINIYPLDQFFTFHLRNSIIPSMTLLPVLFALGYIVYGLLRWKKLDWRDKFLITFVIIFYAILESSPLKPFPGYVRYIMPIIPFLAYLSIQAVRVATTYLPKQANYTATLLLMGVMIVIPAFDSVNLVLNMNRDTRSQLEEILATKQAPIAYELYTRGRETITVKSLVELDRKIQDNAVCTLVASSFMYDRFLFASQFENQDPIIYGTATWYQTLFDTYPYTEIVPTYKSFAFSNPTLRVIDICQ